MVVTQRAKKNSRQRAALRATCCVVYTQTGGRGRGGRGEERRRCATGDESVPIVARKLVPQPIPFMQGRLLVAMGSARVGLAQLHQK